MKKRLFELCICLVFLLSWHPVNGLSDNVYAPTLIHEAPKIDGILNEAIWATAYEVTDFIVIDPETMEISEVVKDDGESPLQNASVAIDVDGTLWIGSFRADRVAYKPLR